MEDQTKLKAFIDHLQSDPEDRHRLLSAPEQLLEAHGLSSSDFDQKVSQAGLSRAAALLDAAAITPADDAVVGLRKLGQAAERHFSGGFDVEVDAFAIRLLERPRDVGALDITATGTTTCTFNPWDGCSGDPDW